jgi:hypothetical protein
MTTVQVHPNIFCYLGGFSLMYKLTSQQRYTIWAHIYIHLTSTTIQVLLYTSSILLDRLAVLHSLCPLHLPLTVLRATHHTSLFFSSACYHQLCGTYCTALPAAILTLVCLPPCLLSVIHFACHYHCCLISACRHAYSLAKVSACHHPNCLFHSTASHRPNRLF